MKDKVSVNIDISSGRCKITGWYNKEEISIEKIIEGYNYWENGRTNDRRSEKIIEGYNNGENGRTNVRRSTISELRLEMRRKLKSEAKDLKYSEDLLNKVDPIVYEALLLVDKNYKTHFCIDYLKSMAQTRKINNMTNEEIRNYKERCRNKRGKELRESGIKLSYNVDLFNTGNNNNYESNKLTLLDKLVYIRFAKNQQKMIGNNRVEINKTTVREFFKSKLKNIGDFIHNKLENNWTRNSKNKEQLISNVQQIKKGSQQRWTRRIESIKDSIENFKPNTKKNRRVLATLAVLGLAIGSNYATSYSNSDFPEGMQDNTAYTMTNNGRPDSNINDFTSMFENTTSEENNNHSQKEVNSDNQKESTNISLEGTTNKQNTSSINENKENDTKEKNEKVQFLDKEKSVEKANSSDNEKVINEKTRAEIKKKAMELIEKRLIVGSDRNDLKNMFDNDYFYVDPDGTPGTIPGSFKKYSNYTIERVSLNGGIDSVFEEGKSVYEILQERPDIDRWSLHFTQGENGSGPLGFVTSTQIEAIAEKIVDSVIQENSQKSSKPINLEAEFEDLMI